MYGLKFEIMVSSIGLNCVVGTREGEGDLWIKKNEKRSIKNTILDQIWEYFGMTR
jgi:hypothetical protein